jgi:hypothetical protein
MWQNFFIISSKEKMDQLFIKKFFIFSVIGVIFIFLFNYLIDPYGLRSLDTIKRINDSRYIIDRPAVALALAIYKPKTIVLGTSRAALGFNSDVLKAYHEDGQVYNAAFAGADFDEMYAYFQHALYLQPDLKNVILGIDLFSFHENRKAQISFDEELLLRDDFPIKSIKNLFLSANALYTSCECLFVSLFGIERENPILKLGEKNYLARTLNDETSYKDYQMGQNKFKNFKKLVDVCKEHSIELKVYLSPVKAMYWEAYWDNNLWPHLENLKRQLCSVYPIWDFSGFNPITMQTLDTNGDSLYYDCSHFTPIVGNLILQRMLGRPSCIDSIGYLLTPETVEGSLAEISQKMQEIKKI